MDSVIIPSIVYKPYCSSCDKEIEEDVKLVYVHEKNEELLISSYTMILPVKCPHCGRKFESINIPLTEETEIEDLKR